MSHALSFRPRRQAVASLVPLEPTADAVAMRHLRHHTKNALQQIIARIAATDLRATPEGSTLADEIERRIRLSARISDALFGLTADPGPLRQRLAMLCDATVALLADVEQTIQTEISVTGSCPESVETTVVQVAHEMLTNAIKHGMHVRLIGRIILRVEARAGGAVTLTVSDDGWGPCGCSGGEGVPIMQAMAERHGGKVTLSRENNWTVACLQLP